MITGLNCGFVIIFDQAWKPVEKLRFGEGQEGLFLKSWMEDQPMKQNPKENSDSIIDRFYFLVIIFLIGALIFFLFMIVSAGRGLNDHWDKGPGIDLGSH
jgi:hypothetical protein